MKKLRFLLVIVSIGIYGCNQTPKDKFPASFQKFYEVGGNQEANSIVSVSDGLLICGTSRAGTTKRAFVLKVDFGGNQLWKQEYDAGSEGYSIKLLNDNSLVIAGSFLTSTQNKNLWISKLTQDGKMLWQKNYGGDLSDTGRDIIQLDNDDFMLIGTTSSYGAGSADMFVVKTDADGNEIWNRTFGGSGLDGGSELIQTTGFEVALLGFTESFGAGNRDIYLQTMSINSDSLASFTIGGNGYEESQAFDRTADGGFILSNHSATLDPLHSVLATKLNSNYQADWELEFGTTTAHEGGEGVLADSEGNYVFIGRTNSFGNDEQVYFIKTNTAGDILEEIDFGAPGDQRGNDIVENGSSYYVVGTSTISGNSNTFLLKHPM